MFVTLCSDRILYFFWGNSISIITVFAGGYSYDSWSAAIFIHSAKARKHWNYKVSLFLLFSLPIWEISLSNRIVAVSVACPFCFCVVSCGVWLFPLSCPAFSLEDSPPSGLSRSSSGSSVVAFVRRSFRRLSGNAKRGSLPPSPEFVEIVVEFNENSLKRRNTTPNRSKRQPKTALR